MTAELEELTTELKTSWTGPALYRRAGDILARIREEGLYKAMAQTFKSYCRNVLDISDAEAYQTMKAARFAAVLEAEAPELPAPATEFTFRPMGKMETDSDRLDCWRRTVERVAPDTPTHEHVKATVAELEGDGEASPKPARAARTRTTEAETSKAPADALAEALRAIVTEGDPDTIVDRLTEALARAGVRSIRPDAEAVHMTMLLSPSERLILSLFVGDVGNLRKFFEDGLEIVAPKPPAREPKRTATPTPAPAPAPASLTPVSNGKGKGKPAATPAPARNQVALNATSSPPLTPVSNGKSKGKPAATPPPAPRKAGRPPGPETVKAREFVRQYMRKHAARIARLDPDDARQAVKNAGVAAGLNESKVSDAIRYLCVEGTDLPNCERYTLQLHPFKDE
jgi:hypothetical protein